MRILKALAAAASLGVMAMASQASAADTFNITNVQMNTTYQTNIAGFGWAYDNGVTFTVSGYPTGETSLFGFCIDVFHDIYLGQSYTYSTNQPSGGGLVANSGTTITNTGGANPLDPLNKLSDITNLVNTGWLLKQAETGANTDDTEARLAAIQAAIWNVAVPGSVLGFGGGGNTALLQSYYNSYSSANWTTLADANDKVFTISNGTNQSFAIGWPTAGVPEPATWAMMIGGFFGMGSALRRSRKADAVAA